MRRIPLKNNTYIVLSSVEEFSDAQNGVSPETILFCDKIDKTELILTVIDETLKEDNEEDIFGESL